MKMKKIVGSFAFFVMVFMCVVIFNDAAEAAKTYRFSICFPPDYFVTQGFERVFNKIKADTNGEVQIKIYPSNQLGNYEQAYQEVMRGTIDMAGNYVTPRFNKKFEIASFPYLVSSFDDCRRLVSKNSPYYKLMKKTYEETGVVYLGSFVEAINGLALTKGKEITDPFKPGNKARTVRVEPTAAKRAWYVAAGYQVATVPYAELFTAMQTGIVDGNTGAGTETTYTVLKDVVGSYVQYNNVVALNDFIISKKAWNSFDKKTQQIIINAFEAEVPKNINAAQESHEKYLKLLKDSGIKIYTPTKAEDEVLAKIAYTQVWPKYYELYGKKTFDEIVSFVKGK